MAYTRVIRSRVTRLVPLLMELDPLLMGLDPWLMELTTARYWTMASYRASEVTSHGAISRWSYTQC